VSTTALGAPQGSYLRGALFVLAAGTLWSFTGAIMRFAPHLDAWQFLFYRCLGIVAAHLVFSGRRGRASILARLVALGRPGLVAIAALTLAAVGFIFALKTTSVANALFFASCSPLLSALLGALLLRERLTAVVVGAIALGSVGLLVMVAGEIKAGNLVGNAAAMLSALGFTVSGLCMRWRKGQDFDPAIFGFAVFCGLLAAALILGSGKPLLPPPLEALAAFANGFIFMGLGFALFVRGAPDLPAAGQTVLAQTETIFGPIWVWLLFAETPLPTTLIGGAIILAAVVVMAVAGACRSAAA
jgi:drug/metabolite transporter (DMT)-like permease